VTAHGSGLACGHGSGDIARQQAATTLGATGATLIAGDRRVERID